MANIDLWRGGWNPMREMANLSRAMDRIFDEWSMAKPGEYAKYEYVPSCEMKEDAKEYSLKFDIPGIPKDQIKVDLVENRLTVSGERSEEKKSTDKDSKTHYSEIYYGSFSRSMSFPTTVDADKITATYDNGILTITVPKKVSSNAKKIAIH